VHMQVGPKPLSQADTQGGGKRSIFQGCGSG
jgi:hypothetical protein